MGELTKSFPPTPPKAIISLDFIEFAQNTGILDLNCFMSEDSSSVKKVLLGQILESSDNTSRVSTGGGSFTKTIDHSFDLSAFNAKVKARGTATVAMGHAMNHTASGIRESYIIVKMIHVRNLTPTTIGGPIQSTTLSQQDTVLQYRAVVLRLPITKKIFKVGDTLRLIVEVWSRTVSGNGGFVAIGHSPKNRDGEGASAILQPESNLKQTSEMHFFPSFEVES